MDSSNKPIEVFCCYAHKDEPLLRELRTHLTLLERERLIKLWADADIGAGAEWQKEIEQHLNNSEIILLLISPDFIASDYCYSIEMNRSLERHANNEALVIPILLRTTDWQTARFSQLDVLPTNAVPLVSPEWPTRDDAFFSVVNGIRGAVQKRIVEQNRLIWEEEARQRRTEEDRQRQIKLERQRQEDEERRQREAQERADRLRREAQEREWQQRLAEEERLRVLAEQTRLAEEARQREEQERAEKEAREQLLERKASYRRFKFRRDGLHASAFALAFSAFLLLGGLGSLIGIITQRWYFALGAVIMLLIVACLGGYQKALPLLILGIVAICGGLAACGLSLLTVPEHYTQVVTSKLWFGIPHSLSIIHQFIAGACIGLLNSIWGLFVLGSAKPTKNEPKDAFGNNLGTALLALVMYGGPIWLVVNAVGTIFNLGFGIDAGWQFDLFYGWLVTALAGFGIISLGYVSSRAHRAGRPAKTEIASTPILTVK